MSKRIEIRVIETRENPITLTGSEISQSHPTEVPEGWVTKLQVHTRQPSDVDRHTKLIEVKSKW